MLKVMNVTVVVLLFLSTVANAGLVLTFDGVSDSDHSFSLQHVLEPQESVQNSTSGFSSTTLSSIEPAQYDRFFSSYGYSSSSFDVTLYPPELIELFLSLLNGEDQNNNNNNNNDDNTTIPEPASGLFAVVGGAYLCLRNRSRKLSV